MIVYEHKVFDGAITGTTPVYTAAELNAELGRAGRWFCTVRVTQGAGTTPKILVGIEHSNDDVNWDDYNATKIIPDVTYSTTDMTTTSGSDRGTAKTPGAFVRLRISLSAASGTPGGSFQIWLCGRDDL